MSTSVEKILEDHQKPLRASLLRSTGNSENMHNVIQFSDVSLQIDNTQLYTRNFFNDLKITSTIWR